MSAPLPSGRSLTSEAHDDLSLFLESTQESRFHILWVSLPHHYSDQDVLSRELDFLQLPLKHRSTVSSKEQSMRLLSTRCLGVKASLGVLVIRLHPALGTRKCILRTDCIIRGSLSFSIWMQARLANGSTGQVSCVGPLPWPWL